MDKAKILYIESNEIQRKTLSSHLRSKGYKVTVAASRKTGLHMFENRNFDVILCDFNIPKINGIEILERIRRRDLDIPFIIFATRGSVALAKKAIKKGANHFVLKPKEINEIVIIIEQVIEIKLTPEEDAALKKSADAVRELIEIMKI